MTTAYLNSTSFKIIGHANYAAHGYDVVCAGISTLVQTFLRFAELDDYKIESGEVCAKFDLTLENLTAYRFMVDGLELIAETYPGYLEVIKCTSN